MINLDSSHDILIFFSFDSTPLIGNWIFDMYRRCLINLNKIWPHLKLEWVQNLRKRLMRCTTPMLDGLSSVLEGARQSTSRWQFTSETFSLQLPRISRKWVITKRILQGWVVMLVFSLVSAERGFGQHNHYLATPSKPHKLRSQREVIEADQKFQIMKEFYG